MVATKRNPYARAYSFGTDGSAALAGSPISSQRPMSRVPGRNQRQEGVPVPLWLVLVAVVALAAALLVMMGNRNEDRALIRRQIDEQRYYLQQAQQAIESLDAQLVLAADDQRIRSLSLNRLGMQEPKEGQVFRVPAPVVASAPQAQQAVEEQPSAGFNPFGAIPSSAGDG